MSRQLPKVGVGVFVFRRTGKEPDILLLHRKSKIGHGDNEWSLPGGHLEMYESIEDCCVRETLEETGVKISDVVPLYFTNNIWEKIGLHYVTLYCMATMDIGDQPKIMEPEKCSDIQWYPIYTAFKELKLFAGTKEAILCNQDKLISYAYSYRFWE